MGIGITWAVGRAQSWVRAGLVVAAALGVSACETSGPINAEDSYLELSSERGWSKIDRRVEVRAGRRIEEWDWNSGAMYVIQISVTGRYYPNDYDDPDDFMESVSDWGFYDEVSVDRREIRKDQNSIGEFQYAIADVGDSRCFLMLQGLNYSPTPGRKQIGTGETSSGFVTFYDCSAKTGLTASQLETRGLRFARGLAARW